MPHVDGFVAAVPKANREAYLESARLAARLFKEAGALSVVENWDTDLPEGEVNSFHTAVMRRDDETVVFSWTVWPSKEARDAAWKKLMEDPRMRQMDMPFDGKRLIHGGFETIFEA